VQVPGPLPDAAPIQGPSGTTKALHNSRDLGPGDLLFATRDGTPISRNTFRTRV